MALRPCRCVGDLSRKERIKLDGQRLAPGIGSLGKLSYVRFQVAKHQLALHGPFQTADRLARAQHGAGRPSFSRRPSAFPPPTSASQAVAQANPAAHLQNRGRRQPGEPTLVQRVTGRGWPRSRARPMPPRRPAACAAPPTTPSHDRRQRYGLRPSHGRVPQPGHGRVRPWRPGDHGSCTRPRSARPAGARAASSRTTVASQIILWSDPRSVPVLPAREPLARLPGRGGHSRQHQARSQGQARGRARAKQLPH